MARLIERGELGRDEHDHAVIQKAVLPLTGPGHDSHPGVETVGDGLVTKSSRDLGCHFGLTGSTHGANTRYRGRLKMPLPPPAATILRIRITWEASVIRMPWDASPPSMWDTPAHEVHVSLPD